MVVVMMLSLGVYIYTYRYVLRFVEPSMKVTQFMSLSVQNVDLIKDSEGRVDSTCDVAA